jgi:hypothetical protein
MSLPKRATDTGAMGVSEGAEASVVEKTSIENAVYKRQVNDLIREGLRGRPTASPIGFFCECAMLDCFTTVWLTGEDYDARRLYPKWAPLAPGHELDHPSEERR